MAKKIDKNAAALAAAQGSVAIHALEEEAQQVAAESAPEPRHEDVFQPRAEEAAAPIQAKIEDSIDMNAETFAPAIEAAEDAGEKMRTMFGANFDGKDVMERAQKVAQDAAELAKGNLEAMAASARIAAQNAGTLTQDAAAVGRKSFESTSEALKGFAGAKSPVELLRLQSEFAKTYMETMIAEGTRLTETLVKLTGEALEPVQSQMAATAAKVKSIAG